MSRHRLALTGLPAPERSICTPGTGAVMVIRQTACLKGKRPCGFPLSISGLRSVPTENAILYSQAADGGGQNTERGTESKAENQLASRAVFALPVENGRRPDQGGERVVRHEDSTVVVVVVVQAAYHRLRHDMDTL
jgi:hypothetical protein